MFLITLTGMYFIRNFSWLVKDKQLGTIEPIIWYLDICGCICFLSLVSLVIILVTKDKMLSASISCQR